MSKDRSRLEATLEGISKQVRNLSDAARHQRWDTISDEIDEIITRLEGIQAELDARDDD